MRMMFLMVLLTGSLWAQAQPLDATTDARLKAAIASPLRSARAVARDTHRHPYETLRFFGLRSDMAVMEVTPGRRGWYRQIIQPVVNGTGQYFEYYPGRSAVPDTPLDMVLTFRNVHNWMGEGGSPGAAPRLFAAFYQALKPGGILGVVEHRWPEDFSDAEQGRNGYVKESLTIRLAEAAGFELVDKSDVNANPKDPHVHPRGVWTLPPTYALRDQERAVYEAIGESDRFTLKFHKPE